MGQDESRICLKDKNSCTTDSHQKNRCAPVAGIYIRSKDPEKVFCSPVGDIQFFEKYKNDVLTSGEKSAPAWAKTFNVWELAVKDNSDPEDIAQKQALAKRLQTPAKRPIAPKLEFKQPQQLDPTHGNTIAYDSLSLYERSWRNSSLVQDEKPSSTDDADVKPTSLVFPKEFILRDCLMRSISAIMEVQQSVMELSVAQAADTEYVDNAVESTNLRVSDLEVMVGVVPQVKGLAPNLWTSVAEAFQDIQTLASDMMASKTRTEVINQQVSDHEDELNKLFSISSGALSDIKQNVLTVSKRVDALDLEQHLLHSKGRDADTEDCLGDLLERIEDLEDNRRRDRTLLEELQASQGGSDAFPYMVRVSSFVRLQMCVLTSRTTTS